MRFSFDSNVLIDALRLPPAEEGLAAFLASGHDIVISSIVAAELELGARSPRARRRLESGVIGVLLQRGRIAAPDEAEWRAMGRLLGDHPEWARSAGRQNDVLLATQCAARGWLLITRDRGFAEYAQDLSDLRTVAPFPLR